MDLLRQRMIDMTIGQVLGFFVVCLLIGVVFGMAERVMRRRSAWADVERRAAEAKRLAKEKANRG